MKFMEPMLEVYRIKRKFRVVCNRVKKLQLEVKKYMYLSKHRYRYMESLMILGLR
jgi:hypothetical protein